MIPLAPAAAFANGGENPEETGLAHRIAHFALDTQASAIPASAIAQAKTAFIDSLGVALAGSREQVARICASSTQNDGGGVCTILGRDFRASPAQAAFANGAALHACDFDYSFAELGQPMAPLLPATLAAAQQQRVSGIELLAAYVVGFEIAARMGYALGSGAGADWHSPGTVGRFGAAAGAGRLLRLDIRQLEMTLGITCSMAGTVIANFASMTKPLHVAMAARDGVLAAQLAKAGLTSNPGAVDGRNGFYSLFQARARPDLSKLETFGTSYSLVDDGPQLKPYPCGGLTHPAIDTLIAMAQGGRWRTDDVVSINVAVSPLVYDTIAIKVPQNAVQAKFCMPYLLARALIDGTVSLAAFTEQAVRDPAVLALARRITLRSAPPPAGERLGPSRIEVRLRNGTIATATSRPARGSRANPLSYKEIDLKFMDCATRAIVPERARALLTMARRLETLPHVGELCALMTG